MHAEASGKRYGKPVTPQTPLSAAVEARTNESKNKQLEMSTLL